MYSFECPRCNEEITAEVYDKIVDWDEECECGYKFSSGEILDVYDKAMEDNISSKIDYAHDYLNDRER